MATELNQSAVYFAQRVVINAKSNLTRSKKNVTKKLYNSIKYEMGMKDGRLRLQFLMEDYGQYQDLGVKGANPSKIKGGVQKAPNSPFKFGKGKGDGSLSRAIDKWIVKKGIAPRISGKFASRKTMKYLITRSIYFQGIAPSKFFTRAFEVAYKYLPAQLSDAVSSDIDRMIETELNKI